MPILFFNPPVRLFPHLFPFRLYALFITMAAQQIFDEFSFSINFRFPSLPQFCGPFHVKFRDSSDKILVSFFQLNNMESMLVCLIKWTIPVSIPQFAAIIAVGTKEDNATGYGYEMYSANVECLSEWYSGDEPSGTRAYIQQKALIE